MMQNIHYDASGMLFDNDHLASTNEFKSSRARLLTLSGVTMYFNSWKFVTVSYSNHLILWKRYVQKVSSHYLQIQSQISEVSL